MADAAHGDLDVPWLHIRTLTPFNEYVEAWRCSVCRVLRIGARPYECKHPTQSPVVPLWNIEPVSDDLAIDALTSRDGMLSVAFPGHDAQKGDV